MPLRIAFDLDGVLADMESELGRVANKLVGARRKRPQNPSSVPADPSIEKSEVAAGPDASDAPALPGLPQLTLRQQRELWRRVRAIDAFWESLDEIEPGAVARLATLAAERRWEIIFLTKRPQTAGATAQMQTQRWLEAKGFSLPSVFVVHGSRGRIADALALDIVVDDTPENCLDIAADSKARAIAVFRDPDKPVPPALGRLGIHVVRSADECLDLLCEIDSGLKQHPGAIDRVMQMLGLKQPASI